MSTLAIQAYSMLPRSQSCSSGRLEDTILIGGERDAHTVCGLSKSVDHARRCSGWGGAHHRDLLRGSQGHDILGWVRWPYPLCMPPLIDWYIFLSWAITFILNLQDIQWYCQYSVGQVDEGCIGTIPSGFKLCMGKKKKKKYHTDILLNRKSYPCTPIHLAIVNFFVIKSVYDLSRRWKLYGRFLGCWLVIFGLRGVWTISLSPSKLCLSWVKTSSIIITKHVYFVSTLKLHLQRTLMTTGQIVIGVSGLLLPVTSWPRPHIIVNFISYWQLHMLS